MEIETLKQLKARAMTWPEPWRSRARELMRDAVFDLMRGWWLRGKWPRHRSEICEDLRQALYTTEQAMERGELP